MEEMFLHAWDELDDALCLCRQLATLAVTGAWDDSIAALSCASGILMAGTATLALSVRQFFEPSA
jgi:hypothetical protein